MRLLLIVFMAIVLASCAPAATATPPIDCATFEGFEPDDDGIYEVIVEGVKYGKIELVDGTTLKLFSEDDSFKDELTVPEGMIFQGGIDLLNLKDEVIGKLHVMVCGGKLYIGESEIFDPPSAPSGMSRIRFQADGSLTNA